MISKDVRISGAKCKGARVSGSAGARLDLALARLSPNRIHRQYPCLALRRV